jgi:hypothetical protein
MNPTTGEWFTFLGGTIGARIGIEELQDAVVWMRRLRGERVIPLVVLELASFRTKFGPRPRPKFAIQRYVEAGADITSQAQIEHKPKESPAGLVEGYPADHGNVTTKLKPVKKPTTAEFIEDDLPDRLK